MTILIGIAEYKLNTITGTEVKVEIGHYPDPQGGVQPPPNLWGSW
jgi:hypothetical protein